MAGFPLMAFGAGLGKFAEQYAQQQEARARNAMLQLTLAKYQRELSKDAAENQAADAYASLPDLGSLFGGSTRPVGPTSEGFGSGLPAASSMAPSGGMPSGAPRPPLAPGVGGAFRSAGDQWLAQNLPTGSFFGGPTPSASSLPWTNNMPPPNTEMAGPGTSGPSGVTMGGPATRYTDIRDVSNIPPPRGTTSFGNPPQQMAQATPQAGGAQSSIPGLNIPPPEEIDFGRVMGKLKELYPRLSPQAYRLLGDAVQKRLGEQYKAQWERFKTLGDFQLRGQGQAETGRHNVESERLTGRGQDLTYGATVRGQDLTRGTAERGQDITVRGQDITQGTAERGQDITARGQDITQRTAERGQDITAKTAESGQAIQREALGARVDKVQNQQRLAVSELRTLADRARYLHDAIESNPNLVGTRGYLDMLRGSVTEQAKAGVTHQQLADFQSQINLLRAQVLKPLSVNKYMTKPALEELKKLVPSDELLASPTQAKAALRNLAKALEDNAERTEAVMGGVKQDYQGLGDEEILRRLGIQPGAQ